MDETERLIQQNSFKSIDSINSSKSDIPAPILSPKASFYKQFKTDTMDRRMGDILKNVEQESPGGITDQASLGSIPKWTFPIDFDLWSKSILSKNGHSFGLKRFLLYSERTGVLKSSSFESLKFEKDPGDLLSGIPFWLDINSPTAHEMNLLGNVYMMINILDIWYSSFDN